MIGNDKLLYRAALLVVCFSFFCLISIVVQLSEKLPCLQNANVGGFSHLFKLPLVAVLL